MISGEGQMIVYELRIEWDFKFSWIDVVLEVSLLRVALAPENAIKHKSLVYVSQAGLEIWLCHLLSDPGQVIQPLWSLSLTVVLCLMKVLLEPSARKHLKPFL